jgi:hypothetical protein
MLTKTGSTLIDSSIGDVVFVDASITALVTTATSSNETFTGGASLTSLSIRGTGETFNFVQGSMSVADYGDGTKVTLGNGNATITDNGAGNTYRIGNTASSAGHSVINLIGNDATVIAGDGTMQVVARGTHENVTLGNGSNSLTVYAPAGTGPAGDIFHLGNGAQNSLTLFASNNTIYAGTGMTFISESNTGTNTNNTVVLNANGGKVSFAGNFTLKTGDHADLTQILAGQGGVTATNIGSFVSVSQNNLTVTGLHGTATITLAASSVPYTLASLVQNNFFILPAH